MNGGRGNGQQAEKRNAPKLLPIYRDSGVLSKCILHNPLVSTKSVFYLQIAREGDYDLRVTEVQMSYLSMEPDMSSN